MTREEADPGLDNLLALDGEQFFFESGYWFKAEVRRVAPSPEIPHGIRYNLTLHDHYSQRVLGYDNAHAVQPERRRFSGRRTVWDHRHEGNRTEPYEFESAEQLLIDFWADIDRILKAQER